MGQSLSASLRTQAKCRHNRNPKDPQLFTVKNGDEEVIARKVFDIGYPCGQEWRDRFLADYPSHTVEVTPL